MAELATPNAHPRATPPKVLTKSAVAWSVRCTENPNLEAETLKLSSILVDKL